MLEQYREEYAQRLRESIANRASRASSHAELPGLSDALDEAIASKKLAVENSERSTKAGQKTGKAQNKNSRHSTHSPTTRCRGNASEKQDRAKTAG